MNDKKIDKDIKLQEKLIQNADAVSLDNDEEMAFIQYQDDVKKSKEARRNRLILVTLSVVIYLLGLGLFATIVQTIYQMNSTVGIVVGIVLLVAYTVCFIIMICMIFSKHSFDLEFRKRKDGHFSERTNNKVRWEIGKNIVEQSSVISYLEKAGNKKVLSPEETKKVLAFEKIGSLVREYGNSSGSVHSKDSSELAEALSETFKKNGVIYNRARRLILKRSAETGTLTALSQNAMVDAGVVVMKNMQMIKDIVWLYGFRPTNTEMNKIIMKVIKAVAVSIGLNKMPNNANWVSKVVNKDSNNFLVQMLGNVIDMGAQFLGNGAMTYLIGKYTVNAMLSEYHVQELFRQTDLKQYQMEITGKTIHDINATIDLEVQELKNKPEEDKELTLAQTRQIKEIEPPKKNFSWDILHIHDRVEKRKAERKAREAKKQDSEEK